CTFFYKTFKKKNFTFHRKDATFFSKKKSLPTRNRARGVSTEFLDRQIISPQKNLRDALIPPPLHVSLFQSTSHTNF
ncbi:MAG: hypothetical protein MUC94_14350, partial [bacterium]|nr:hypothetical protein [bacterium]